MTLTIPSSRSGHTVLEVLVVALLIGVLTLALTRIGPSEGQELDSLGTEVSRTLDRAHARAQASGTTTHVIVDPNRDGTGAYATREGMWEGADALPSRAWTPFPSGVVADPGEVSEGPRGEAAAPLEELWVLTCEPGTGCHLRDETSPMETLYLRSERDASRPRAVVVTPMGASGLYKWNPDTEVWR